MAVPEKETWRAALRRQGKFGLSASSFGAALGHCGRVSDYVHYVRCIVGTENEFRGNVATAHGIDTEPLAKLAYEGLFDVAVEEGGFFVDESNSLACSPDGIVTWVEASPGCRITQRIEGAKYAGEVPRRVPTRILEIKSPFRYFYSGSRAENEPHGIPHHYMCQMQGQMAITGAAECDFFVFVRYPRMSAVAFRVHRSDEFWAYAKPKLLEVVSWIEASQEDYERFTSATQRGAFLNRQFVFPDFDFGRITVEPLLMPVDLVTGTSLLDPHTFPSLYKLPVSQRPAPPRGMGSPLIRLLSEARIQPGDVVLYSSAARASHQRFVIDTDSDCDEVVPVHDPWLCQVISMATAAKPIPVAAAATSPVPVAPCGSWRPLRQVLWLFTDAAVPPPPSSNASTAASKKHRAEATSSVKQSPAKKRLSQRGATAGDGTAIAWDPFMANITNDTALPFLRRSPATIAPGSAVTVLPPAITSCSTAIRWLLHSRRQSYRVESVAMSASSTVRCVLEPSDAKGWSGAPATSLTPSSRVMCCSSRVVGLGTDVVLAAWADEPKAWAAFLLDVSRSALGLAGRDATTRGWRTARISSVATRPVVDSDRGGSKQNDGNAVGAKILLLRANQLDDLLQTQSMAWERESTLAFHSCIGSSSDGGLAAAVEPPPPQQQQQHSSHTSLVAPEARVWLIVGKESSGGSASAGPIAPRSDPKSSALPAVVLVWLHDVELEDIVAFSPCIP